MADYAMQWRVKIGTTDEWYQQMIYPLDYVICGGMYSQVRYVAATLDEARRVMADMVIPGAILSIRDMPREGRLPYGITEPR